MARFRATWPKDDSGVRCAPILITRRLPALLDVLGELGPSLPAWSARRRWSRLWPRILLTPAIDSRVAMVTYHFLGDAVGNGTLVLCRGELGFP